MTDKHAVITDEMVARARSRIGQEWVRTEPYFNVAATRDTIRHFCQGIGDVNPLYTNPEYARNSRYGRLAAPPCFLYSVHWPCAQGGLMPGIHAWHAGNDWELFRPILEGDELSAVETLTDVVEKKSQMAGRIFIPYADTFYRNQRGELVARAKGWTVVAERGAAGSKGKYAHIEKATYTVEKLREIEADYDREEIRGANPRYWEDVKVGEELTPVVKGPLSMRDNFAWLMGGGSPYIRAHRIELEYRRRHPAVGMIDSTTGQVDVPELVHMEESRAKEIGVPGAYDYGCQRMSWLGQLPTNWIGDDGFLKRLYGEIRLFNVVGDTTWLKGRVVEKQIAGEERQVRCEIWGENQRGDKTIVGWAIVLLPSRVHGPVVLPVQGA